MDKFSVDDQCVRFVLLRIAHNDTAVYEVRPGSFMWINPTGSHILAQFITADGEQFTLPQELILDYWETVPHAFARVAVDGYVRATRASQPQRYVPPVPETEDLRDTTLVNEDHNPGLTQRTA